uniref:mucin-21-like isoform X4 n=1 Tax=Styela clava TaxID=7725 RepID=UPI001939425E|nr:mucin-21-like isoform X4 [Styela clava]
MYFSGSPGTFVPVKTPDRGATVSSIATSSTSSYHNLTFTPNILDNESNVTLEREGCSAETKTSSPTTLDLRYGDTEHFGSSFVADKSKVEYNTTVIFSCDPAHYEPASFTAVLLADATWEPSDAPVTCTRTTTTSMTTIIATTEATVTDTTTALSTAASNTQTSTVQQSTEITQSSTHGNVSNNNASLSLVTSLPTATETNSNTTGDGSAERQVCPGLKDGELAGIAFVIIYASITLVWVYLVFDRNKNIKIAIKKTVLLGVCKFICWIIGIGLLFGATEDWCDLTGGNIAGIVFGVIAVLLGILYCFLNHKQFFDETPISAGTRVSPAPVPQNGETAPEQMEMNPEDSL